MEEVQVVGIGLSQKEVHVAAAVSGGTFNELYIFGTKDDSAHGAIEVTKAGDLLCVETEAAFGTGPVDFDFVFAFSLDGSTDKIAFLTRSDHLGVGNSAKGAQGGEEVDGFKEVAFALSVVPYKEVESRKKVDIKGCIVAKGAESKGGQDHVLLGSCATQTIQNGAPFRGIGGRLDDDGTEIEAVAAVEGCVDVFSVKSGIIGEGCEGCKRDVNRLQGDKGAVFGRLPDGRKGVPQGCCFWVPEIGRGFGGVMAFEHSRGWERGV